MRTPTDRVQTRRLNQQPLRRATVVALCVVFLVYLVATLLSADERVLGCLLCLVLVGATAVTVLESLTLSGAGRVIAVAAALILVLLSVLGFMSVSANWPLYAGRAAHDAGDSVTAGTQLEKSLERMDDTGISLLSGRYKLTTRGVVFVDRVTTMVELAEIAVTEGRTAEALTWLRSAVAVGQQEPQEDADVEFLKQMISEIEGQTD